MAQTIGGYFDPQSSTFAIDRTVAAEFFEKAVLLNGALNQNPVNLFSYGPANLDGTVEMLGYDVPTNSLQGRTGDRFIPKGKIQQKRTTTAVVDFELNKRQRPTAFFNDFFGFLQNPDRPYDWAASPEFQQMLGFVMDLIKKSLSSDVASLFHWWNHPDIPAFNQPTYLDDAKTQPNPVVVAAQPAGIDIGTWLRFHDQHTIDNAVQDFDKMGAMAKLDSLYQGYNPKGYEDYKVVIPASDYKVSAVGNQGRVGVSYEGDVGGDGGLFQTMVQSSSIELEDLVDTAISGDAPVFCVSPAIFNAYINEYRNLNNDNVYYGAFLRASGQEPSLGLNNTVAQWYGCPVVKMKEFSLFDNYTGKPRLRAMLCAAQNLSVRSKIRNTQGSIIGTNALAPEGGLIIQQSPLVRDKGLIDMLMNGSVGAGFADYGLVTYAASKILSA